MIAVDRMSTNFARLTSTATIDSADAMSLRFFLNVVRAATIDYIVEMPHEKKRLSVSLLPCEI